MGGVEAQNAAPVVMRLLHMGLGAKKRQEVTGQAEQEQQCAEKEEQRGKLVAASRPSGLA